MNRSFARRNAPIMSRYNAEFGACTCENGVGEGCTHRIVAEPTASLDERHGQTGLASSLPISRSNHRRRYRFARPTGRQAREQGPRSTRSGASRRRRPPPRPTPRSWTPHGDDGIRPCRSCRSSISPRPSRTERWRCGCSSPTVGQHRALHPRPARRRHCREGRAHRPRRRQGLHAHRGHHRPTDRDTVRLIAHAHDAPPPERSATTRWQRPPAFDYDQVSVVAGQRRFPCSAAPAFDTDLRLQRRFHRSRS